MQIRCNGTEIRCTEQTPVTTYMTGAVVSFSFDEQWDGINGRLAVFRAGNVIMTSLIDPITSTVFIPWEVLRTAGEILYIGAHGFDANMASWPAPTPMCNCGTIIKSANENAQGLMPSPTIVDQAIIAADTATKAKVDAEAAADEAEAYAKRAEQADQSAKESMYAAASSAQQAAAGAQNASAYATAAQTSAAAAQTAADDADAAAKRAEQADQSAKESMYAAASSAQQAAASAQAAAGSAQRASDYADAAEVAAGKYDDLMDAALSRAGAGGECLTVDDGAGSMPVKNLWVTVNPHRDGSGRARPDNPRAFVPVGSVDVSICGKNLFDATAATFASGYINASGGINASTPYSYCETYIPVAPNTAYQFSGKLVDPSNTSAVNAVAFYTVDKEFISRFVPAAKIPAQFTTPSNCRFIRFNVSKAYYDASTIQLEAGTAPTWYEPYSGGRYTIDWTAYGQGLYGARVDFTGGKVTPTWRRVVEDGTQDVADGGPQPNGYCVIFTDVGDVDTERLSETLCDRLTYTPLKFREMTADQFSFIGNAGICVLVPGATNFDDACYAIVEQPLTFVYPLATPGAALEVTPVEVKTLPELNHLWTSGDLISVYYRRDTAIVIARLAARVAALERGANG